MEVKEIIDLINNNISKFSLPVYSDDEFDGITKLQCMLDILGDTYDLSIRFIKSDFYTDGSKRWLYSCENRWKPTRIPIIIRIIAHDCGTIDEPFSKYSITAYAS